MTTTNTKTQLTIKSVPPTSPNSQRRSFWPGVFGEARHAPDEWRRTVRWFSRATAQQAASDIRNAHTRSADTLRVRGVMLGDVWEARWGRDEADQDPTHFYIWLRLRRSA